MLAQIISDLHLETFPSYGHYKHRLTDAPCLCLMGDIGHVSSPQLFKLFTSLLDHYDYVCYLLGNHDPKDLTMDQAKSKLRRFEAEMAAVSADRTIGRFVFLDQTRLDLDSETTVLGCTLFSNITDAQKDFVHSRMIDFKETKEWTVAQHNTAHASDVAWLNAQVAKISREEPSRRIAILTHHSPTVDARARDPRHTNSSVSSAFATDLSHELCWTSPNVTTWAFGHTHWNCDFVEDATGKRVFTNQRGYWRFPKASFDELASCLLSNGRVFRSAALVDDSFNVPDLPRSSSREGSKRTFRRFRGMLPSWISKKIGKT